jgi:hypothetical protein
MSYPTSRRHPRTMLEAWQIDGANAIEHYRADRAADLVIDLVVAVIIGVPLAIWLVHYLGR